MIIPIINAFIYFVIFLLLLIERVGIKYESFNIPSLLMLLFIPLYLYSALNISTFGDELYFGFSIFTGIYISTLSILMLVFRKKTMMCSLSPLKLHSIILMSVCVVMAILASRIAKYYYSFPYDKNEMLIYIPLFIYIALLVIYVIFVIIAVKRKKNLKEQDLEHSPA